MEEYDVLFIHANIVDVYLENIIQDACIGVKNGVIQAVDKYTPDLYKSVNAEKVIDCNNQYLAPGLMDAHVHIETSHLNPYEWSRLTVRNGTTSIFCDLMLTGNVYGEKTVELFKSLTRNIPTRIFYNVPSRVPAYPGKETAGGTIDAAAVEKMLKDKDVTGLGEVSALSVLTGQNDALEKIKVTRKSGKRVSGHCPDIHFKDINRLALAGITDDHESLTFLEVKEKLSRGIAIMIRDGSVESSIHAVIPHIVAENLPIDNIMFCTDDKNPVDISKNGHLNATIRKAVALGLDPVKAVKMSTLNVAKYFRMEENLGSLTPGRQADIVIFKDLNEFEVDNVYIAGKSVKELNLAPSKQMFQPFYYSFKLRTITKQSLEIKSEQQKVKVRVIEIDGESLLTKEKRKDLLVVNNVIEPSVEEDILSLSVVERYGINGNIANGFVKGIGLKDGAVACSLAQEGNNIIVCGTNSRDMALAVNTVAKMDGGYVLTKNNEVRFENPMRLGGIMYDIPYEETIVKINEMGKALEELGCNNKNVFTYLAVGSAPSIPEIGITDYGLIDSRTEQIVPVIVEGE